MSLCDSCRYERNNLSFEKFETRKDSSVAPLGGSGRLRVTVWAIRHHGVHGCCTSAVGDKKGGGIGVRDVGGEKKGSRGRESNGGGAVAAHACPTLRLTSRRWRSVIIVTPLQHLVAFGYGATRFSPFLPARSIARSVRARESERASEQAKFRCLLPSRRRRRRRRERR